MNRSISLHALLAEGRAADYPVCHTGDGFVLWQEFSARVEAHAAGFRTRDEHRWLLAAGHPLSFVILLLALLHAGKEVVIPPNTQPGTLTQLANCVDAQADDTIRGKPIPLGRLDPASAIIDLYTSGSTGAPKSIRKTLHQFEVEIDTLEDLWGRQLAHSRIAATAPHLHFYGLLFRLLWPLTAGRVFDARTCAHPDTLQERLALLKDCTLVSSPAQLGRLPELLPLVALQPPPRLVFSSGGPLSAISAREFHRQLGAAPTEVFGSTETGGIAWRRQEEDDLWTPLPGIRVLADRDGALLLHSRFLATNEPLPYRMDDAIELLADGRFRLCGRLDRTIKIEEKRLSLPALEARLAEHPWVAAAGAIGLVGRRQSIGAAVALNADGHAQLLKHGRRTITQELRRHLSAHFDAVLLPRHWRFPQHLPINERGKLTHAALEALFATPA